MNIYQFSWSHSSFDHGCQIEASTETKAREIFKREVIGENTTWAANHATVSNLNNIYTKEYLKKMDLKIHWSEKDE